MIIRAIRVAETGPFARPIRVEGLNGRLDVLVAPNEAGKSTLLAALAALVGEKHTSTARHIAALRPDAGGAPLIEADLELDGRRVRVRKRFLAQRSAELIDLDRGNVWRGADAEAELERLIGGEEKQALRGLMWVRQGDSFDLPTKPEAALGSGLAQLIEAEASDSAGGGAARRLAALVKERLGTLVTIAQGKARANSDLDKARRQRDDITTALSQARLRAGAVEQRRQRLDALRLEVSSLASGERLAALKDATERSAAAVRQADEAREKQKTAAERVGARQLAVDGARSAMQRLDAAEREADVIRARLRDGRAEAGDLGKTSAALRDQSAEREAASSRAVAALDACRNEVQRLQTARVLTAETEALAAMERRHADAHGAGQSIAQTQARLAANRLSAEALQKLRDLQRRIEALEARIAAEAATVSVVYSPEAREQFRVDGRSLAAGETIIVESRVTIDVPGIGSIEIVSATSGGSDAAVVQRDVARRALADGLGQHGVSDLSSAEELAQARQRDEMLLSSEQQRLRSLAPDGLQRLAEAHAAQAERVSSLSRSSGMVGAAGATDWSAAEAALAVAERASSDAASLAAASRSSLMEAEKRLGILAERQAGDERRLVQVEADLGDAEGRARHRKELSETMSTADRALAEAVREQAAWAEAVPGSDAYAGLVAAATAAAGELARLYARRGELEQEIAEVSGALRRDGEDGSGSDVPRLEEALAVAEARLADLELDVRALRLLNDRLDAAGADHRGRVLKPVIARLEPMLARLFPGASLAMEGPLLLARLERSGQGDPITRLSGGTREQVATMVRLAYAGLLADQGQPMPVVLDDALVFSDDRRLAIMIELLAAAANKHQVFLLSCHQRAIEPLVLEHGATQVRFEPWDDSGQDGEGQRAATARSRLS